MSVITDQTEQRDRPVAPVPSDLECELFHPKSVLTTLEAGWIKYLDDKKTLSADVWIKQPFGPVYIGFKTSSDYTANMIALYARMMAHARTGGIFIVNPGKLDEVSYKYNAAPKSRFNRVAIGFVRADAKPQTNRRTMYAQSGPAFMPR